jgi:hypothetical protein
MTAVPETQARCPVFLAQLPHSYICIPVQPLFPASLTNAIAMLCCAVLGLLLQAGRAVACCAAYDRQWPAPHRLCQARHRRSAARHRQHQARHGTGSSTQGSTAWHRQQQQQQAINNIWQVSQRRRCAGLAYGRSVMQRDRLSSDGLMVGVARGCYRHDRQTAVQRDECRQRQEHEGGTHGSSSSSSSRQG